MTNTPEVRILRDALRSAKNKLAEAGGAIRNLGRADYAEEFIAESRAASAALIRSETANEVEQRDEHATAVVSPGGVTTGAIGSVTWPGLTKLVEEGGELGQVVGKLLAYPAGDHPDGGPPLRGRLENEIADIMAACRFATAANGLDAIRIEARAAFKLSRFAGWHEQITGRQNGCE